jgi:hypothetical protein
MYEVKYKPMNSWFWRKLKRVKADGIFVDAAMNVKSVLPYRWFILEDETRVEVPMDNTVFKFNTQRFLAIKQNMSAEAGQSIVTK